MRRSNSRSGLARSNSTRSVSSNAESNAARSAAAAAASALAAAQRRTSVDITSAARPSTAPSALQRRDSVGSLRSNTTAISNKPGQYSAVRQTGSRRLYGAASTSTVANPQGTALAAARLSAPKTQTSQLRETMRSKPPQAASSTRRQNNMSSNASIRSFQSDLERINEDYNKTYAYVGQTSASAMKTAAAGRPRRAESVVSSAMSDTSEAPGMDLTNRKKASRVSFSDIDESEIRSRTQSPNPERRKSALKASPVKSNGTTGRGIGGASTLMPPPALQRRASNSSIRSNTSAALGNPVALTPVQKQSQQVPTGTAPVAPGEDGKLSTIASNSAYSDADEDFVPSPALQRHGVLTQPTSSVPLTQQNLAAVGGEDTQSTPLRSALKKTPSQTGSERFSKLETDSQLDIADDESDDSFAARRKAKQIGGRRSLTTLRGTTSASPAQRGASVSGSVNGAEARQSPAAAVRRSPSVTSQQSQEPTRMVSLRQKPQQQRRHSLQATRQTSSDSVPIAPAIPRRTSMQSLTAAQPPIPPKSVRRASVAGSVAESVRSDAVNQHVAVMELAQRRVQRMLHPEADESGNAVSVYADATERKRSSFERKRPTGLSRQNSSSSMIDRSFRTSLRPESAQRAEAPDKQHRRAASDDRAFATTLRGNKAPPAPRSSSMFVPSTATDTQSMPATPKKSSGRRMSFTFGRKKEGEEVPPVPTMRRYSSDSEELRPTFLSGPPTGSALSAGTLRAQRANPRPTPNRHATDTSILEEKTAKPKKFQALRRLFKRKN